MEPTDPKLAEALAALREGEEVFERVLHQLKYFDANKPPYPDRIRSQFREHAQVAENVKMAVLSHLAGLDARGDRWYEMLKAIPLSERYPTEDLLFPSDARPSHSGLITAGHVLENARTFLSGSSTVPDATATAQTIVVLRNRRGPKPDLENYRELAKIVENFSRDWKHDAVALEDLCRALDKAKIPVSENWPTWEKPARRWVQACRIKSRPVVQAIDHRLKAVRNADASKPSQ